MSTLFSVVALTVKLHYYRKTDDMKQFIQKPKSKRSLEKLPDGTVVYAVDSADRENMSPVRYIISDSVPGMERMVRPETDYYFPNDLSVDEFFDLGWKVLYALEPSFNSLRELALVSSRIILEAENGVDLDRYIWLGEFEENVKSWFDMQLKAIGL